MQRIKKISRRLLTCMLLLTFICALTACQKADPEDDGLTRIPPEEVAEDAEDRPDPADEESAFEEPAETGTAGEETTESPARIFVHVCGQVQTPGVYELAAGSRLFEALEAAGGLTAEAAGEVLNQAQLLDDGQQVYVPAKKEVEDGSALWQGSAANAPAAGSSDRKEGTADRKVNINQAAKEELMTLTGIGEVKAGAIIRYREEHGPFGSIEEIKEIDGIKDGVFQKIRDDITV